MIKLKNTAYANPTTETERAVRAALDAWCDGPVPPYLLLGLQILETAYEEKHELCEVERAERYVAECWAEYKGTV